jgi:hypothetical protein
MLHRLVSNFWAQAGLISALLVAGTAGAIPHAWIDFFGFLLAE